LIDGDVIGPFELRSRELERGGERSAPAADHRDLYGSVGQCAAKSFFFVLAHAALLSQGAQSLKAAVLR
jgi:hypothetical protein